MGLRIFRADRVTPGLTVSRNSMPLDIYFPSLSFLFDITVIQYSLTCQRPDAPVAVLLPFWFSVKCNQIREDDKGRGWQCHIFSDISDILQHRPSLTCSFSLFLNGICFSVYNEIICDDSHTNKKA